MPQPGTAAAVSRRDPAPSEERQSGRMRQDPICFSAVHRKIGTTIAVDTAYDAVRVRRKVEDLAMREAQLHPAPTLKAAGNPSRVGDQPGEMRPKGPRSCIEQEPERWDEIGVAIGELRRR